MSRVLLIAEACNPDWTSVPLVGWNHASELARHEDVHVVTSVRNQSAIEARGWVEGEDFTAIDHEWIARPTWRATTLLRKVLRLGWMFDTAFAALPYWAFERAVWRRFGSEIEAGRFDLVHRLIPLTPTHPSPLAKRCEAAGVPFLLGPLNGGLPYPKEYPWLRFKEGESLSLVRDFYKWLPAYASTRDSARAIVTASLATREQIGTRWQDKTVYVPENAVDVERFPLTPRDARKEGEPLRVCFVGRLVPYKGCDVLIEALADFLRNGQLRLEVIGDGPQRGVLEAQVAREGLGDSVHFAGWLPQSELAGRLREHDLLGFPSVREFGGGVVAEAMAVGTVPVIVDYGGPAEIASPSTALLVPVAKRAPLVAGFRSAFERILEDPEELVLRGRRAQERIGRYFTWPAKAAQMRAVYDAVIAGDPLPDFGAPFPEA